MEGREREVGLRTHHARDTRGGRGPRSGAAEEPRNWRSAGAARDEGSRGMHEPVPRAELVEQSPEARGTDTQARPGLALPETNFLGAVRQSDLMDQPLKVLSRRPRRRRSPGPPASGTPTPRARRSTSPAGAAPWTSTAAPRRPAGPAAPVRSRPRPDLGGWKTAKTVLRCYQRLAPAAEKVRDFLFQDPTNFPVLPRVPSLMRRSSFPVRVTGR